MIADEYFRVRADLGTALFFLQTLGHETHARREVLEVLQESSASLREPFLFVVIGAEKAGKSSLLNALFGRDLCSVDASPRSDVIQLLKYGSREKEVPLSDGVLACYRPVFLLRDFTLADTPGGPMREDGRRALAEQFLPRADLVLFVVSVVDPWNAEAWERLRLLDSGARRNLAIVVQQSDLRNPVELDAVVQHLKQVVLEKLSIRAPVFPISAKMAFLAKTSGVDKVRLLSESGVDRLEKFIDAEIARGPERWGSLRSVWQKSDAILRDLAGAARAEFSSIQQNEQALASIESTLQNRKQQSLRQVNGELWSQSQLYERAQKRGEEALDQGLSSSGLGRLLFRGGESGIGLPEGSAAEFADAMKRHIEKFLAALNSEVAVLWAQLHQSMPADLAKHDREETLPERVSENRSKMIEELATKMREQSAAAPLQSEVNLSLRRITLGLRSAAAGLIVAVIAFAFLPGVLGPIVGSLATVITVWGIVAVVLKRQDILRKFVTAMVNRREALLAPVEDFLCTNIESAYAELSASFERLRTHVAEQRSVHEPIIARVKELEGTFVKSRAELGLSARP